MKLDKLTVKSQELLQAAHELARRKNHAAIEPLHFVNGMLADKQGVSVAIPEENRSRHGRPDR
jgi:ATP-dependent Clp protease ATP-binding subunit ClpB